MVKQCPRKHKVLGPILHRKLINEYNLIVDVDTCLTKKKNIFICSIIRSKKKLSLFFVKTLYSHFEKMQMPKSKVKIACNYK